MIICCVKQLAQIDIPPCSTLLVIEETQMKMTMLCHHSLIKMSMHLKRTDMFEEEADRLIRIYFLCEKTRIELLCKLKKIY